jgi:hypothetical protein
MGAGDVADVEPVAPVLEQVEWEDAADSLPGADHEELGQIGRPYEDKVDMQATRSTPSPTGSEEAAGSWSPTLSEASPESVGSRPRPVAADPMNGVAGGDRELGTGIGEKYFCVSVSGVEQQGRAMSPGPDPLWQQEVVCPAQQVESTYKGEVSRGSTEWTGPNSLMQMIPREPGRQLEGALGHRPSSSPVHAEAIELADEVEQDPGEEEHQLECSELARVKSFCSSILKSLAPPLLSEFERTTGLRADAEPFTPKRVTRRSAAVLAGTQVKMASAAESSLLKALGVCPENLPVKEDDLRRFKEFFDSPIQDAHIRVLAAIFGKELSVGALSLWGLVESGVYSFFHGLYL